MQISRFGTQAIAEHGADPSRMVVEVTETAIMRWRATGAGAARVAESGARRSACRMPPPTYAASLRRLGRRGLAGRLASFVRGDRNVAKAIADSAPARGRKESSAPAMAGCTLLGECMRAGARADG